MTSRTRATIAVTLMALIVLVAAWLIFGLSRDLGCATARNQILLAMMTSPDNQVGYRVDEKGHYRFIIGANTYTLPRWCE